MSVDIHRAFLQNKKTTTDTDPTLVVSFFSHCPYIPSHLMMKSVILIFLLSAAAIVRAQECDPNTKKCDQHERCPIWRDEGECYRSRTYMIQECPVSCKPLYAEPIPRVNAQKTNCQDIHENCGQWAANGECKDNYVGSYCSLACGKCDRPKPEKQKAQASSKPKIQRKEMETDSKDDPMCQDMHELCSFWAEKGECNANPNYMHTNCAKSCNKCAPSKDKIDSNTSDDDSNSQELDASIDPDTHDSLTEASVQFGVKQTAQGTRAEDTLQRLASTLKYMNSESVLALPANIQTECKNRHEMCTFWQVLGECDNNKCTFSEVRFQNNEDDDDTIHSLTSKSLSFLCSSVHANSMRSRLPYLSPYRSCHSVPQVGSRASVGAWKIE